jgi:hypothetical protein
LGRGENSLARRQSNSPGRAPRKGRSVRVICPTWRLYGHVELPTAEISNIRAFIVTAKPTMVRLSVRRGTLDECISLMSPVDLERMSLGQADVTAAKLSRS